MAGKSLETSTETRGWEGVIVSGRKVAFVETDTRNGILAQFAKMPFFTRNSNERAVLFPVARTTPARVTSPRGRDTP